GTGIANSPLSGVELLDAPGDALAWRGGGLSQTGSLRATSRGGGRSTVAWQVEMRGGPLTAARWIVAGGALMIAVIYWVLSEFALPSEHPGARGQVFQMAQAIHVLWPPFLTAGLARVGRRKLIADLERTLRNLAFVSPA
ncbi:MAG: hypothetical protein KDE27_20570, partial [Planctomycetes bacterium]|nr:hypothetical protein [Planctomycetota bacterium]